MSEEFNEKRDPTRNGRRATDTVVDSTLKSIIVPLIVAGIVGALAVWGNSLVMDYKLNDMKMAIAKLEVSKVDKEVALTKWTALEANISAINNNMQLLIQMHMTNPIPRTK